MTILMYTMLTWTGVLATILALGALYVTADRLLHCGNTPSTGAGTQGKLGRHPTRAGAFI